MNPDLTFQTLNESPRYDGTQHEVAFSLMLDPIQIGFVAAAFAVPAASLVDGNRFSRQGALCMGVLALLASLESTRGLVGTVLVVAYLIGGVVLGVSAVGRALNRPVVSAAELGLAMAWVWVVGGGAWLLVWASRGAFLGFSDRWALLTAAHFHAAGFGAVSVTALVIRATGRGAWLLGVHAVAFVLVAVGLTGPMWMQQAGAIGYLVLFTIQFGYVTHARIHREPGGVRVNLATAVPIATLLIATEWAFGGRRLNLDSMAWLHGCTNAVGHGLLALWGFAVMAPKPSSERLNAPFSRAWSRGRVGPEFVAAMAPPESTEPKGLTPNFAAYARPDLLIEDVDPEIVTFYEQTRDWDLRASQSWQPGFRLGGRIFGWMARRIGQMGLPGPGIPAGELTNAILDVDDTVDGRQHVRAWVRTWKATGTTLYAALYSEHVTAGIRTMNIAFPTVGGNLTSILHLESQPNRGLALTSLARSTPGDQGVYFKPAFGPALRLPLDETIEVRREPDGLSATHHMWVFGRLFLRLEYRMTCRTP